MIGRTLCWLGKHNWQAVGTTRWGWEYECSRPYCEAEKETQPTTAQLRVEIQERVKAWSTEELIEHIETRKGSSDWPLIMEVDREVVRRLGELAERKGTGL